MDQHIRTFLESHKQAVIATIRKDGSPHLTSVLAVFENDTLLVSIAETRVKYRHLLRDPRASMLILGDHFFQYVVAEGRCSMLHLPDARIPLREYYEKATGGPHPDWDEYDTAMEKEQRVLLRMTIEKVMSFNVG